MATQRQVRANRKNAQLSTGPRSIDGKRRAASNALKHGLTSKEILLPHEDAEAFEAFARDLRDAFAPIDAFEEFVVERIVTYAWRIKRATVFEAALHARAKQENVIENYNRGWMSTWPRRFVVRCAAKPRRSRQATSARREDFKQRLGTWRNSRC